LKSNNTVFDLCCITTFSKRDTVNELLDSLRFNNNLLSILFIIVNQTEQEISILQNQATFFIINTSKISLSKARNLALQFLFKNKLQYLHLMFPDDDSTFSSIFFYSYKKYIKNDYNYLIDVYSLGSTNLFKPNNYRNFQYLDYKNFDAAMSVNMVISKKMIGKTNYFDEMLGVGSKFGGGEDVDFYVRVCKDNDCKFIYIKDIFYFHPSPNMTYNNRSFRYLIKRFIAYGNGTIYALCKNNMYFSAIYISIRGLGGFFISLISLHFKLSLAYLVSFITRFVMIIKYIFKYNRQNNKCND
jgi:hypothetical protein